MTKIVRISIICMYNKNSSKVVDRPNNFNNNFKSFKYSRLFLKVCLLLLPFVLAKKISLLRSLFC